MRIKVRRLVILLGLLVQFLHAQTDWPGYGHDKGAQRYSPLAQINTANVSTLIPAWTFSMKTEGVPFRPSQSIPLVVNGVMYLSWPFNRVAAFTPETGALIWEFTAKSGFSGELGLVGRSSPPGRSPARFCIDKSDEPAATTHPPALPGAVGTKPSVM